jgi:hypothetical protein
MTFKEFLQIDERNAFERRGGDTSTLLSYRKRIKIKPIKPHMGLTHKPSIYIKK